MAYKTKIMKLNNDKIRIIRIQKGFSQEYIAEKLDISQPKYSRVESGNADITISVFGKLIELLEINPTDILILSDDLKERIEQTA